MQKIYTNTPWSLLRLFLPRAMPKDAMTRDRHDAAKRGAALESLRHIKTAAAASEQN